MPAVRSTRTAVLGLLALVLAVSSSLVGGAPAVAAGTGSVEGTVTAGREPAPGVCVDVYAANQVLLAKTTTGAGGGYQVAGVPAGSVRVGFVDCSDSDLLREFYVDEPDFGSATPVTVTEGQAVTVDASLAQGGGLSGRVTTPPGTPRDEVCVRAYGAGGAVAGSTQADPSGSYRIGFLPAGDVRVEYAGCSASSVNVVPQWYGGGSTYASADAVTVSAAATTRLADVALAAGGRVHGTVRAEAGPTLGQVCVEVLRASDRTSLGQTTTSSDGTWSVVALPLAPVTVSFTDCGANDVLPEYFEDQPSFATATVISLTAGAPVATADARLAPSTATTTPTLPTTPPPAPGPSAACTAATGALAAANGLVAAAQVSVAAAARKYKKIRKSTGATSGRTRAARKKLAAARKAVARAAAAQAAAQAAARGAC